MTGIADDGGGTLTATGVVISGDDVGLSVEGGSTATVTGSSITGDYTGIWVANAGTATVTQSAITGCTTGILVGNGGGDVSTLTAQQDRITGDVTGVQDVQNPTVSTAAAAAATGDWWGSLTGPTSSVQSRRHRHARRRQRRRHPLDRRLHRQHPGRSAGLRPDVHHRLRRADPARLHHRALGLGDRGTDAGRPAGRQGGGRRGNLGINFNGSVALTLNATSGSGTLAGTSTATAVAGVATFSGLYITEPGTYTLTAATSTSPWTGLTAATSSPSTTVADGALTDTTSAQSYNATAGNSISSSNGNAPVILATFTDANPHATASDYNVSVTWGGSATSTSDSVQLVSTTSTSSSWMVVGNATYPAGGTFTVSVTVTDVDQSTNTFTDTHTTITRQPRGPATASFLKQDTTTQGTWIGTYGAQGYDIVSGPSSLPTDDTVTPSGEATYTWTTTSTDPRALQIPGSSNRVAAVWYSATSFTVDVNLADGQTHDLELYFDDWDNRGRSEQVQISNAATGTVLDTETISSFTNGVYLDWQVSGNLLITITREAGVNAVLNGLFIDSTASPTPTPTPTSTATFLKQDATTQGTWIGTYGAQGYDIVSGPSSLPTGDTVTPSGEATYTWTTTSTDPRALQVPGSSNRVAAVWYSATSFTVDVNLADGQTHDLELYFDDWDNRGRSEQVQISNAATGTVLDTETISSFTNGVYLDWQVSGNLLITITREAGVNAVLNGLFIDSTASPTPTPTPTSTATFLKQDATTQGTWINTYGGQGYDIVSGPSSLPTGDTVTPSGEATYTWTTTSTDPRPCRSRVRPTASPPSGTPPPASPLTSTSPTARPTTSSCTSTTGTTGAAASRCRSAMPPRERCWTPRRSRRSPMACTWTGRSRATC